MSYASIYLIGDGNTTATMAVRSFIKINNVVDRVEITINWNNIDSISINNRLYYPWDNVNTVYYPKGTLIKWETNLSSGEFIANESITI